MGALPRAIAPSLGGDPDVLGKISRLRAGARPRVLDLFAGCGGMSLGFLRAGCEIVAGVEIDPHAAASHALNFHRAGGAGGPRDIAATDPATLAGELGLGRAAAAVDIVVGGPPCQAYARVGRAKLAHLRDDPKAFRRDPRQTLWRRYIDHVRAFRPVALVIENVPDILNQGGDNVAEAIAEALGAEGYEARYTLLNAAFYGVPQARERLFLVAHRRELGAPVRFPAPTRRAELPPGYASARAHALRGVGPGPSRYLPPPQPAADLPPAVTVAEALGDLPQIDGASVRRGPRRPGGPVSPYRDVAPSGYARLLREWPGFPADPAGVADHAGAVRCTPRDGWLFAAMPEGAQYPEALAIAERRLAEEAGARGESPGSPGWQALRQALVPPYDPTKFPNRWWKMRRDAPARTLMAHLGKDGYSHIHPDPAQGRTISVREAARLQSFPDGFRFEGTMNPAFRQIGNAVPPLLAAAVAGSILEAILEGEADLRAPRRPIWGC